ncbi:hypothetical protein BHAOGJBA_5942 [Methylobacterium hispanicum]|uniref:Uncharacterized protein n=1 Tax=Methylobacterium hispanicum TaxID=270350 RepID=A0AAV4ZXH0_9HYPH|nr:MULTISPECIES: hypothetical protein [Methylobacterium]GJD92388.1 hypothetical protein BHAOGJBA_5942 [Methylobacterium hispanicum]
MSNIKHDSADSEQVHQDYIAVTVEASRAEDDSEHGAEEPQSFGSAKGHNLYAGLSLRDQIALGVVPVIERGCDPAGRPTIELEVTLDRQTRFFDMAAGEEAVLHVTCLGTEGVWQRLRVRKVIWNSRRA